MTKLSVCIITYNHERYIAQALDSVLMQRLDVPWEVVIGEDCSTDGTGAIVREYAARHPERIRLLDTPRNLGAMGKHNFVRTMAECRGEYVALLEGDDYWTDPEKLRRQVETLDANPETMGCGTLTQELYGETLGHVYPETSEDVISVESMFVANPFHTCSVMYRCVVPPFPDWYYRVLMGDLPLHIIHAMRGPFRLLRRVTAVYRLHAGGVWSHSTSLLRKWQEVDRLYHVLAEAYPQYRAAIATPRSNSSYLVVHYAVLANDWSAARAGLRQLTFGVPKIDRTWLIRLAGAWARVCFPSVYRALSPAWLRPDPVAPATAPTESRDHRLATS